MPSTSASAPSAAGGVQRRAGHVDRDDPGARGDRDLDRGQSHAAAAVDGDPLAGLDAALGHDGAVRGREAAAEARGGHEVHRVGEPDHVQIRAPDCDELGERSPSAESRLELVVADLVIAGEAARALAAGAYEWHRHAVSGPPLGHARANRLDDPGELVAGDMRQRDVRVVPDPAVPVGATQPGRLDPDDRAIGRDGGLGDVADRDRPTELLERDGAHDSGSGRGQPATGRRIEYSPL